MSMIISIPKMLEITPVLWPEFMIIQYPTFQAAIMPTIGAYIVAVLLLLC